MNAIPLELRASAIALPASIPAIFDQAPMGFCLLDRELRCTSLNRRILEMTGCCLDASPGQPLAALMPSLLAAVAAGLRQALAGSPAEGIEIRGEALGLADKGRILLASIQPMPDPHGEVEGLLLCLLDLGDAHGRMAEALRESMDHHRHAVEFSPHVPWTANPQGEVLDFGPRWLAHTGFSADQTTGSGWVRALHPDDAARTVSTWSGCLSDGEPFDVEYRIRSADGAYRWFRARAGARRDEEGRIIRWYGTVEDVHDRRLAEEALRESEAFSRSILDNSPDCMKILDLEGRLLFMSAPGLCAMEIEDFAPLRGTPFEEMWDSEDRIRVRNAIGMAREGRNGHFTAFCSTGSGKRKWLGVLVSPIREPDGRIERLLCVSRDITHVRQAKDEIERSRAQAQDAAARLSAVLESTTDSVIFIDCDWRMTYANGRAAALLATQGLRVGDSLRDAFQGEAGVCFDRHCRSAMMGRTPVAFEQHLAPAGLWLEAHAYPAPGGLSIFFRDISERRRAEQERRIAQERIAHMARHDALTGLANRILFGEQLECALAEVRPDAGIAVLCLDLDGFKSVNDMFGHAAGDTLLRETADRLCGCLRGSDRVARFGADEFAILQAGLDGPESAGVLARRLIAALGEPYELDGQQIAVGASIGIALAFDARDKASDLNKHADLALHAAKAAGRNSHRFFEPQMDEGLREKHALRTDLRLAVIQGGFTLHYQPILDLRTDRIAHFEALLRWPHPERGFVAPGEFIPVAEETGMILVIGEWALREACREAAAWPDHVGIAVNLSAAQFRDRDLVRIVADTLAETGLAAHRLELEITESVLLQDSDANLAVLRALKRLGIRIVMDDFGTGYSSLGYLRRFAFDKIKIDRSFVADLPEGGESRAIVRAVVGLGESPGLAVTAEGVETRQQLDHLRAEGCDQAQGYLFSPAVPADAARALMAGAAAA